LKNGKVTTKNHESAPLTCRSGSPVAGDQFPRRTDFENVAPAPDAFSREIPKLFSQRIFGALRISPRNAPEPNFGSRSRIGRRSQGSCERGAAQCIECQQTAGQHPNGSERFVHSPPGTRHQKAGSLARAGAGAAVGSSNPSITYSRLHASC